MNLTRTRSVDAAPVVWEGHTLLAEPASEDETNYELANRVHQRLVRDLDEGILRQDRDTARRKVEQGARQIAGELAPGLLGDAKEELVARVVDEVVGLGPIEALLRDRTISEVMVNGPSETYFERDGRLFESDIRFRDDAHIMRVIDRIVSMVGRHVDEASPMVDARLADGSRVNIVIPPLTTEFLIAHLAKIADLPRDRITPQTNPKGLGIDSLTTYEFAMAIEDRFGFRPPQTLLFDCSTIADVASYLVERKKRGKAA